MASDSCHSATPAGRFLFWMRRDISGSRLGMKQRAPVEEDLATAKTPPASSEQFTKLFNHSSKGEG